MKEYHKINTVYKRDPETKFKTLVDGDYSCEEFAYLENNEWEFTEKVDGTNIRVMIDPVIAGGNIRIGGKSDNAQLPAVLLDRLLDQFLPHHTALNNVFPNGGCLYGEGYGARIQKGGGNYRQDQGFVLFDVMVDGWWLQRSSVEATADTFKLDIVPIIGHSSLLDMVRMAKDGFNSTWGPFPAEGIVARPKVELKARNGDRIITKIKHKDFA